MVWLCWSYIAGPATAALSTLPAVLDQAYTFVLGPAALSIKPQKRQQL